MLPPIDILLFGDSMVKRLNVSNFSMPVRLFGWSGEKLGPDSREKIHKELRKQDRRTKHVIILHFGTNNVGGFNPRTRQSPEKFVRELRVTINELHRLKNVSVVVSSILPRPGSYFKNEISKANKLARSLCCKYKDNVRFCLSYKDFLMKTEMNNTFVDESLFNEEDIHLNYRGRRKLENILDIAAQHAKFWHQ